MSEEFYSNREIYEKLMEKLDGLSLELQETREIVNKYNGLRENQGEMMQKIRTIDEKVADIDDRLICIEKEKETKEKTGISVREWGLLAVAILSLLMTILTLTGVIG